MGDAVLIGFVAVVINVALVGILDGVLWSNNDGGVAVKLAVIMGVAVLIGFVAVVFDTALVGILDGVNCSLPLSTEYCILWSRGVAVKLPVIVGVPVLINFVAVVIDTVVAIDAALVGILDVVNSRLSLSMALEKKDGGVAAG